MTHFKKKKSHFNKYLQVQWEDNSYKKRDKLITESFITLVYFGGSYCRQIQWSNQVLWK